ncbi:MAG: short-chain fatty acid transporter [Bacteroidetes bacterium]|nr:MAG: short-chain fatty acid transporter [Bacteroidota bacterium]
MNEIKRKKRQIPHTYVVVFGVILLSALLTWFVPGGEYVVKSVQNAEGVEVEQAVFQYVDAQPQTWQVFGAMFKGFEKQAGIIIFIFIIGGAFGILNASKAIDVGIMSFLRWTRKLERFRVIRFIGVDNIILTLVYALFSTFGAVFGMSEETIAFIIIIIPLAISMGYDSIVGVNMVFVAAGLGFAGAILNPFTIGIAQGLAGLPLFSGIEYRLFMWIVLTVVGLLWLLVYARKVKRNPRRSLVYEDDAYWRARGEAQGQETAYYTPRAAWITYFFILVCLLLFSYYYTITVMKIGNSEWSGPIIPIATGLFAILGFVALRKSVHFYILTLLAMTILFLVVGVMGYGWYIMKIAALFLALGIFSGMAKGESANMITKLFLEGSKDILSAALIVGLAGGIVVILEDGRVIDTLLHGMAQSMQNVGQIGAVGVMYVIQTVINIAIPSGSAKAAITMPVMAPFSDLIGLSRQATVVAFQLGDGFTNMITPTSGVLMGVLGVAKIPYEKWVRWIGPFMVLLIVLGFLLLIPTVTMHLNGF